MNKFALYPALLVLLLFLRCESPSSTSDVQWEVVLHQPGAKQTKIATLPETIAGDFHHREVFDDIGVDIVITRKDAFSVVKVSLSSPLPKNAFVSLRGRFTKGIPYNFNGETKSSEIYRQSPHDVNAWIVTTIAEQAVPVVAVHTDSMFHVAVSASPFVFDNFTSQGFYVDKKYVDLCSGDDGGTPGIKPDTSKVIDMDYNAEKTQKFSPGKVMTHYPEIGPGKNHSFEAILFSVKGKSLRSFRKAVNQNVAAYFSGEKYNDYFGALAFSTAYMNLRANDTQKSNLWVVPSVEYANTQYGRDAFWISMMLTPEQSSECLRHELSEVNHFAEYPLLTVLWAFRCWRAGAEINMRQVQNYLDAIQLRVKDNKYYSYNQADGRLDFQYWGDVMAFEKDDVLAYNQGLFALTVRAANEMGLNIKCDPLAAAQHYREMYNDQLGFYPISEKKSKILGPDPLIPDLLCQLYFNEKLVASNTVASHFNKLTTVSKTPFGFKIVATPEGEYLPSSAYDIPGYVSQVNREHMPDGRYFRGGSYFLYDNLFLIDAYLHDVKGAEELLFWRVGLDFKTGNTTYETLNTKSGEPWKPNMGWNIAVYAIWRQLVDDGRASGELFKYVDSISAETN
jgi:hypothetical protein